MASEESKGEVVVLESVRLEWLGPRRHLGTHEAAPRAGDIVKVQVIAARPGRCVSWEADLEVGQLEERLRDDGLLEIVAFAGPLRDEERF